MEDLALIYNGKEYYKKVCIKNRGGKATGAKLDLFIGTGLDIISATPLNNKGTYSSGVWTIGDIEKDETVCIDISVSVLDYTIQPLYVTWAVSSNEPDSSVADNSGKWEINNITCEEVKNCVQEIIPDPQTLEFDQNTRVLTITQGNAKLIPHSDYDITINGNNLELYSEGVLKTTQPLPNAVPIPTNVSAFTNDAGYITQTLTQEEVQDFVASLLAHTNHTNITVTYDDANNELLFVGNVGGTGLTQEQVEDIVATMLTDGTNITSTYDDTLGTYTISVTGLTSASVGLSNVPNVDATQRANHTGTQTASTISDFDTEVSNNTSVVANTAKVSFPEAPSNGQPYSRFNGTWVVSPGPDNWGSQVIQHSPNSTSSGDGTTASPLLVQPIYTLDTQTYLGGVAVANNTWTTILSTAISPGKYISNGTASFIATSGAEVYWRIVVDDVVRAITKETGDSRSTNTCLNTMFEIGGTNQVTARFEVYFTNVTGMQILSTDAVATTSLTKFENLRIA